MDGESLIVVAFGSQPRVGLTGSAWLGNRIKTLTFTRDSTAAARKDSYQR